MCGRYSLYADKEIYEKFGIKIIPNYNICPNTKVLILNYKYMPQYINWGIKTNWLKNKSIINARLESLENRRFFNNYKKCVFIANGYIEWNKKNKKKEPYYHYINNNLIYFAGIYNEEYACIVTTSSLNNLKTIHYRQPVILSDNQIESWVEKDFFIYKMSIKVNIHKISNKINNPNNNNKNLLNKI